MRFSDTSTGLLILAIGVTIAGYAQTFPPMPGQNVGPSLFPTLIGLGLALLGLILTVSGLRQRGTPHFTADAWMRRPRMAANGALVIASLIFYATIVDALGFFLTSFTVLSVLWLAFGARGRWIAPLAVAVTLIFHYGFYTLLHVPLPWGVFERFAW
jgi:putative tricarboxylic transport membrane protein